MVPSLQAPVSSTGRSHPSHTRGRRATRNRRKDEGAREQASCAVVPSIRSDARKSTRLAAEDGASANNVPERSACQQPSESERLDHLVVRRAARERLALDRHGADYEDVGEHHDEGLCGREGGDRKRQRHERRSSVNGRRLERHGRRRSSPRRTGRAQSGCANSKRRCRSEHGDQQNRDGARHDNTYQ